MNRWGWVGLSAGTVTMAGVGLAFTGWVPGYSARFGIFPATAAAFHGNAALMRRFVNQHRPVTGVATARNQLAWELYDDLIGTQFGYTVAGLQHTQAGNIVSNIELAVPRGVTVTYRTLGTNPYDASQILVGKYVTVAGATSAILWQVYTQAAA